MSFNPDPSKQAQEVIFSRKIQKTCHPSVYFNNNKSVKQVPSQKHLGMNLDTKLNFLKLIELLGYYGNCKTFCRVDHY